MVAVKGKLNTFANRVRENHGTKSVGIRNFKIYVENDRVKVRGHNSILPECKKSVPVNKGITRISASDSTVCSTNLEKSKGKRSSSIETNVGRKVLADVSNVRGNLLRNEVHNGSKPGKGKSDRIASLKWIPVGSGIRTTSSLSSKPFMGKVRANLSQAVGDYHNLKRVGTKVLKGSTDDLKTKGQGHEFVKPDARTTARKPPPPTRKCLPVLKRVNGLDTSNVKENAENGKGKYGFPVKPKVGRKVVPLVSRERSHLWRNQISDGFIKMASKGQPKVDAIALSRKSVKGKVRANLRQAVGDYHNLKRVGTKVLKGSTDDLKTKGQGHEFVKTDARTTARNPPPPTRKCLSVLKRVNRMDTSDVKENAENGKGKYGFPVKPKVGRKVVPLVSGERSHLWRNQISDGFIKMALKGQPKVDAIALSRKSVKPIVKNTLTVSNTLRTLKCKSKSGVNKSFVAAMSSKREEKVATSSLSENIASIVLQEQPAQEELPYDGNSNFGTNTSDVIAKRKSDPRKSYTSILMARSKLLEDHGVVTKPKNLPCIYDDRNHLEVAEYVDDIYLYYWVMQAHNQSLANYMAIQTEITPQMRGILINWLIDVHTKFDLMQETLYLMISLLDRYLSLVTIKKNEMQLVGLTALLLASKYEDYWHPRIIDLITISAESYTRDQMLETEKAILKKLKFRLNVPTAYIFMLRFLKAAQSDTKLEHLAFYLIELCLVEYEALKFKPSLLAASAIYVARCTLHMTPAWTPLLGKHSHYEESQIRDCAEMILRFQKAAKKAKLKVTYEKYERFDHSRVAAIKPLDKLPL